MPAIRFSSRAKATILVCLLLSAVQPLHSQPGPIELVAPSDTALSVVVYNSARQPELARFFNGPDAARLADYAVVITNRSTKDIVGVAVRWKQTGTSVRNPTTTQSVDSFGMTVAARQVVIPAGGHLIATPNGFQHVAPPLTGGFASGGVRAGGVANFGFGRGELVRIDELDRAQRVTANVDTIIFADGRVVGADESDLVGYVKGMDAAVKDLVRKVRGAMSSGQDVDEILRIIVTAGRSASFRTDPVGFALGREAEMILRLPPDHRTGRLDQLDRFPSPPAFFR